MRGDGARVVERVIVGEQGTCGWTGTNGVPLP